MAIKQTNNKPESDRKSSMIRFFFNPSTSITTFNRKKTSKIAKYSITGPLLRFYLSYQRLAAFPSRNWLKMPYSSVFQITVS
ncbi:hypothetical protein [Enterococcus casseliflavus]|uniref:hypothetical protein n=1 Tax=Enterococcus casseliflavus TaxID=37734 RepID=UPI00301852A9